MTRLLAVMFAVFSFVLASTMPASATDKVPNTPEAAIDNAMKGTKNTADMDKAGKKSKKVEKKKKASNKTEKTETKSAKKETAPEKKEPPKKEIVIEAAPKQAAPVGAPKNTTPAHVLQEIQSEKKP